MHGECVQRVFPPYYFSGDIGTVFERILDHEIEYFERGLLVREMTATSSGLPESGIQAFDRVRRVHQPTQLRRVGQKRRELFPVCAPESDHRRVLVLPLGAEISEFRSRCLLVGGGVDE